MSDGAGTTLVTGAAGHLGSAVVDEIVSRGEQVVALDRRAATTPGGVEVLSAELTDPAALAGPMSGCDAVINCAAIPQPTGHDPHVVFTNNTAITHAVLLTAERSGIAGVVTCSSASIYGSAYGVVDGEAVVDPVVPVSEDSALVYVDPYALSKHVDELTAAMFARRGMSVAALRFHWIATEQQLAEVVGTDGADSGLALPLWGYVAISDAVEACLLAREATRSADFGFHPVVIAADDTIADTSTEDLLRRHQPTTVIATPIPGCASGYDTSRARDLLGWRPQYRWRRS